MDRLPISPSRLRFADIFRVGSLGLRSRKLRTALSAVGITIGIAAMVGVLGLSESSRAKLLADLDRLGTNLLVVQATSGIGGGTTATLPTQSPGMVDRIRPVESTAWVTPVTANVFRNQFVPTGETGGITVNATSPNLVDTLNGHVASGRFLDASTTAYPNVVLGSVAAQRLGIATVTGAQRIWVGSQWFAVIGMLDPFPLAANLDRSVLVGRDAAVTYLGADTTPTSIYIRTSPDQIDAVRGVLPATVNPASPDQVQVSRPSDAIAAKAAAETAFTALFLGLGAVALLVGGIGIANVMVIAVIERRNEIGLRRALGATRAHIRRQFLTEALLLAVLGGVGGVALGAAVTAIYANVQAWPVVVPRQAIGGGVGAAVVIGAIAGLYPAVRAARLAPTDALRAA